MYGDDNMTDKELLDCAKKALVNSYAPYSGFNVGAALLTDDNTIFLGCNIENASYGATVCAERTALFKAVSEGYTKFSRIAVVAKDGSTAFPCGICLQVMNEFMPKGDVILEVNGNVTSYKVKELLPHGFVLEDN